jgi:hypothetical protein
MRLMVSQLYELNIVSTTVITFPTKTNKPIYEYNFFFQYNKYFFSEYLEIYLDSKLYFRNHFIFVCFSGIKWAGLIHSGLSHFSSLECVFLFCFILVRHKVEYASGVCNSITSTNANKQESLRQKFTAFRSKCSPPPQMITPTILT